MSWDTGKVQVGSGRGSNYYGYRKGGIAVVDHVVDPDGLKFFGVVHIASQRWMGFLFCGEDRVLTIVDEIVHLQDWSAVKGPEDMLASTKEGLADFRTKHFFLAQLPNELDNVAAQFRRVAGEQPRFSYY